MDDQGGAAPEQARTPAEFVALLRQVKEVSGLTYRQLELRAAERGDLLPRSTVAGALSRAALPKAELVEALVRACEGEERVGAWLAARDRIASGEVPPPPASAPAPAPAPTSAPSAAALVAVAGSGPVPAAPAVARRRPRSRVLTLAAGVIVVVALAAVGASALNGSDEPPDPSPSDSAKAAGVPSGVVRVQPLRAAGLCLTDGRDREGRYGSHIAVFRPCGEAVPPTTELEPLGGGVYRVRWAHPEQGRGCLAAPTKGTAKGFLEPWNDCGAAARLRVERRGDAYVLRLADGRCVGVNGSAVAGAEAVLARCGGADAQRFLIRRGARA
ncbi:RICIN domain-containing protein [Streptomyces huasconensis]|uniref:RICIN domain-containing protein n=1 Tax=Streptomyces huasconensis TaxID=1854574 RepID=UPI0036FB9340